MCPCGQMRLLPCCLRDSGFEADYSDYYFQIIQKERGDRTRWPWTLDLPTQSDRVTSPSTLVSKLKVASRPQAEARESALGMEETTLDITVGDHQTHSSTSRKLV